MKKWHLFFVTIFFFALSSILLKDLFKPLFYTSHDGPHQVVRLYYFQKLIMEGQIPPRWVSSLLNGWGYPLFIFSYHLPWLMALPFLVFKLSVFASIKAVFFLSFFLSGITMFMLQKTLLQDQKAAFVGSLAYMIAPYRFSNIFVRASIGDAVSFIFYPLILLAAYQLTRHKSWRFLALGAISLAAVLLSHALSFSLFVLSLLVFLLFFFYQSRHKSYYLLSLFLMFSLAIIIAAYYFFPALIELGFTNFNSLFKSAFLGQTFVAPDKLIYSRWGYGTADAEEGAMSFQLGIVQWLSLLLLILYIGYYLFTRRTNKIKLLIIPVILSSVWSIFLMIKASAPLWQYTAKFINLDYSWRMLSAALVYSSIAVGLVVLISKRIFVVFLLIFIMLYTNRNHLRINQVLDWPLQMYLLSERSTNSMDEYTPRWARQEIINKKPNTDIEFEDKTTTLQILAKNETSLAFDLRINSQNDKIKINKLFYPGWKMLINNKVVKLESNNDGLMELVLPKGEYKIKLFFSETSWRLVADLISVISLIVTISLLAGVNLNKFANKIAK